MSPNQIEWIFPLGPGVYAKILIYGEEKPTSEDVAKLIEFVQVWKRNVYGEPMS